MATIFLEHDDIFHALNKLLTKANDIFCAVAFWGKGSENLFKDIPDNTAVKLLCNLSCGGTNPYVIEDLMKNKNFEIRQNPKLHAKIYYTDNGCLIGSANASSNGLAFDGICFDGWTEGCVLITDTYSLITTRSWLCKLYDESIKIDGNDLDNAKINWKKRKKPSFIEILQGHFFDDQNMRIAIYSDELSPEAENIRAKNEADGAYEDWPDLKPGLKIIDIHFEVPEKFLIMGHIKSTAKMAR